MIRWAGATPVPLPAFEERDFGFAPDELEALLSERTKLVILNPPRNPTGGVFGVEEIGEAARLLAQTDAWVLSDEVCSQLVDDGEFASIASEDRMLERTILLDGPRRAMR